jgi:hypothetical protein
MPLSYWIKAPVYAQSKENKEKVMLLKISKIILAALP